MAEWCYNRPRAEFICPCGVGHYARWARSSVHGCCNLGCCGSSDYPGRIPLAGCLAVCDAGQLGVVTSVQEDLARGRRLDGSPWEASRCAVLSLNFEQFLGMRRGGKALSMPHLHLKPYLVSGWPSVLQYVEPARVKEMVEWWRQQSS